MSYVERHSVAVTTIADGSATVYSPPITGRILNVIYVKTDFTDGVDFTITVESTGQNVWTEANVNAAKTVCPVQAGNLPTGAASTLTEHPIMVANDRLKIVIAAGGDTKTGTFIIVVG